MLHFWRKNWFLWAVYALSAVAVSLIKLHLPLNAQGYTGYENYLIFKNAPGNLLNYTNPYAYFFSQTWDQYKYSPAFAIGMMPFAALPDVLGLPLWNLLNALVLLAAILRLPALTDAQKRFMAWFVFLELLTSMQNSQSNGLTAGLFLWAYIALERGQSAKAGGMAALNAFIKIFGGATAIMIWLYPKQWMGFVRGALAWTLALTFLPLLFIHWDQMEQVYAWWWKLLREDHAVSVGLSVQGWLERWFGLQPPKMLVTAAGLAVFAASVFRVGQYQMRHTALGASLDGSHTRLRALAWASLLLWSVIFNHKAESPTFVIAMCGIALWYSFSEKKKWETVLMWAAFVLVSLSPTDVFPRVLREQIVQPFVLKALPCILLWGAISWKLLRTAPSQGHPNRVG